MIFNEILIPQDSFTETNVTRKRSVVGNSHVLFKISSLINNTRFILLLHIIYLKKKIVKSHILEK